MNLDLIRYTDKYLGTFLRLILYYFQKFRDLFPPPKIREPFQRILVIKFWGIGNLVRASATFQAIRHRFPHAYIALITLSQNKGVYEEDELFDEVLYLELKSLSAFLWDLVKKYLLLRKHRFDLTLNLEPLANFAEIVSYYVSIGARVGFTASLRRSLFNIKVPFREDEHISQSFYRILYPFGLCKPLNLTPLPISISESDRKTALSLFSEAGIKDGDFTIAFNVNASSVADARRWPPENFAALADKIASELEAKIIYIGAPYEKERVQEVIDMTQSKGFNTAGKTNLKQCVAILAQADAFVTNDSGPMHLAMAMGTPTVALFGPESPMRYGPVTDIHIAIYKYHDCSPCIKFAQAKKIKCKFNAKCVKEITVEEVFRGVEILCSQIRKNRA